MNKNPEPENWLACRRSRPSRASRCVGFWQTRVPVDALLSQNEPVGLARIFGASRLVDHPMSESRSNYGLSVGNRLTCGGTGTPILDFEARPSNPIPPSLGHGKYPISVVVLGDPLVMTPLGSCDRIIPWWFKGL
ncbi:hypothetical protein HAX54_043172 [Datura stramonium]|uniref:Uncharacterized protein n=1 Tax=Datura stramonium TaxID=4076 RepID=A0ABS8W0X9_DATST|nr:hypothetical protein [Datura stramonium]